MAIVSLIAQTDMSYRSIWYGTVYRSTSSEIILSDGNNGGRYYGAGFTYSANRVSGGTLTGYDGAINVNIDSLTYDLTYTIRGLNLSASTAYNYIQSGDALGLQEWGLSGNDVLNGSIYSDTLLSYNGNDTINGGSGNDTMIGGLGNDIYVVDSFSDVVTENASQGTDLIQSSVTYTASANV
jgi:Ca2+-binding RTX toxin-like protein